jgi:hypothetical protein
MANTSWGHPQVPPGISPEDFELVRAAAAARNKLAPDTGDLAPDFELPMLDSDGGRVRLSALRGRAVALAFGSYT